MKTLFLYLTGAIPPSAETTYRQELVVAIAAAVALLGILSVVFAFIATTFAIIRWLTSTLRAAIGITVVIMAAVVVIGLLNR